MSARRTALILGLTLLVLPVAARAQATWQPASPPLVTAENEGWFQAGTPIIWSGDYYFPAGARQFFNGYEMVRAGSFRGIPLYTDATREPFSIVFVPVTGGLMQPYERRRSGALAGTTGSTAPSFPTDIAAEGVGDRGGLAVDIAANPGPPSRARAYDLAEPAPAASSAPATTATARVETLSATAGTTGRVTTSIAPVRHPRRATPARIWVNYEGRRWFANGVPITTRPGEFTERGRYHGYPVFARPDDPNTIYIPTVQGGLLTPFRLRPGA